MSLDIDDGEAKPLTPVIDAGSGKARDPHLVRLEEVLTKINDLFSGEDFTLAEQQSWVEGLVTVLIDNNTIRVQASAKRRRSSSSAPTCPTLSPTR